MGPARWGVDSLHVWQACAENGVEMFKARLTVEGHVHGSVDSLRSSVTLGGTRVAEQRKATAHDRDSRRPMGQAVSR